MRHIQMALNQSYRNVKAMCLHQPKCISSWSKTLFYIDIDNKSDTNSSNMTLTLALYIFLPMILLALIIVIILLVRKRKTPSEKESSRQDNERETAENEETSQQNNNQVFTENDGYTELHHNREPENTYISLNLYENPDDNSDGPYVIANVFNNMNGQVITAPTASPTRQGFPYVIPPS